MLAPVSFKRQAFTLRINNSWLACCTKAPHFAREHRRLIAGYLLSSQALPSSLESLNEVHTCRRCIFACLHVLNQTDLFIRYSSAFSFCIFKIVRKRVYVHVSVLCQSFRLFSLCLPNYLSVSIAFPIASVYLLLYMCTIAPPYLTSIVHSLGWPIKVRTFCKI